MEVLFFKSAIYYYIATICSELPAYGYSPTNIFYNLLPISPIFFCEL